MPVIPNIYNKYKQRLNENYLTEGTQYDKKASQIISNSGLFPDYLADEIIEALFKEDIHAFVHAPAWLEKYLLGIARMIVEQSKGDPTMTITFLQNCIGVFDEYLEYVKATRPRLTTDKDRLNFDNAFNNTMKYQDVKNKLNEINQALEAESDKKLANTKFSGNSNYQLIPIKSFEQMREMFGGHWTGDGSSDKYAGGGGTAWCHANAQFVYDSWVNGGKNIFFVLANNNWKNLPFNAKSNAKDAKDDYGNSLIAILVSQKGKLLKATLRSNHVGNIQGSADNQYRTYAELSDVVGFNVKEKVLSYLKELH